MRSSVRGPEMHQPENSGIAHMRLAPHLDQVIVATSVNNLSREFSSALLKLRVYSLSTLLVTENGVAHVYEGPVRQHNKYVACIRRVY